MHKVFVVAILLASYPSCSRSDIPASTPDQSRSGDPDRNPDGNLGDALAGDLAPEGGDVFAGGDGAGDSSQGDINLEPATIAYPTTEIIAVRGIPVTPVTPVLSGPVVSVVADDVLPAGLSVDPGNGTLSGTPSQIVDPPQSYTIRASSPSGDATAELSIGVMDGWYVDDTTDVEDADSATSSWDGVCDAVGTAGCTLRAAIEEAAAHTGHLLILVPGGTYVLEASNGHLEMSGETRIRGSSASTTILSGADTMSIARVNTGATVELERLTVANGASTSALRVETGASLRAKKCIFENNSTPWEGGAINANGDATLYAEACVFRQNHAEGSGGAVLVNTGPATFVSCEFDQNAADGHAGAIRGVDASLSVYRSLFTGNSSASNGGAIDVYGDNTVHIESTTFFGNTASGNGGAIRLTCSAGDVTIINTTVVGNRSLGNIVGGMSITDPTTTTVINTVFADNLGSDSTPGNCLYLNTPLEAHHNVSDDDSCASIFATLGSTQNTNPGLEANLTDHGGLTKTLRPESGSILIDAGSLDDCPGLDQRGEPRPADGNGDSVAGCDIGAFEVEGS